MIADPIILLMVLVAGHFFFDFAGQGEFMSFAKNTAKPMEDVPSWLILFGHASIHAAFVAVVTGYWIVGAIELFVHFVTDWAKCAGRLTFERDQYRHLNCKFYYWMGIMIYHWYYGIPHLWPVR